MKTLLSRITVHVVILILVITGCGGQTVQPTPATQPTAAEIIEGMVARMNAGDVEGSLAYFADDAMAYIIGLPPTGMEVCGEGTDPCPMAGQCCQPLSVGGEHYEHGWQYRQC